MSSRYHYPPDLPVSARREDIADAIREHQVVILAGATGSGKTTQLPKICMELGRSAIAHTQPRRIAARAIAERVSEELGEELGRSVGYRVRFTDQTSRDTSLTVMTDGILLAELGRDRRLSRYDTIIIDEAHERSLTIDFLLGYLKRLLPERPELKVIITSATIDPESFSRFFGGAPVIEVSGRSYPVEIRYRPLAQETSEDDDGEPSVDRDLSSAVADALDELGRESNGDVLVFLSGEGEIRDVAESLIAKAMPFTEILPLYGRLSAAEQHRVFTPPPAGTRRRVVLATNVAETSLTVPGIRYVVDAGTARISRYSTRAKVQRLPIEAISQASATQRSGRSGRTSDGIAIRLYSEEDFQRRPEYTEPEILRTNLAAVLLQMSALGLGAIEDFPFLTPPVTRGVSDGIALLKELGALDGDGHITRTGRSLSRMPTDPRFGRMVLEAGRHGVAREVIAIVAGLSIQDPRERPADKKPQAEQQHARFTDPTSDFLSLLGLWNYLEKLRREVSGNQFRKRCRAEYLNYLRVREWQDVERQLRSVAKQQGVEVGAAKTDPDGIHKSLLAGLLSQLALRDVARAKTGQGEYLGARGIRLTLWPGSALSKRKPEAIMSAELVETSRLFARMNAAIDPAWAEPLATGLLTRSYAEPHWERKTGAVIAYEKVLLYGLPIIPRRRIQYRRINPEVSRELFIRHALVEGDWESKQAFDRANSALRAKLAEVEERSRRRDILQDDEAVFAFYDARIPEDVATTRDFEGWWRKTRAEQPELLTMREADLLPEALPAAEDPDAFPEHWQQGEQRYRLKYRFEPGAEDDGVTVQVPLELLPGLRPEGFDWLVPGLREELVTALIKALPKAIRRSVVPAADWAARLMPELPTAPDGSLLRERLAQAIRKLTYTPVDAEDFELERLPAHLSMGFAAVDHRGRVRGFDKDLAALQTRLAVATTTSVARAVDRVAAAPGRHSLEREGITAWDVGTLPAVVERSLGPNTVRGWPALVDERESVALRILGTEQEQHRMHRAGVLRLLLLATPSPVAYLQEHLSNAEKLTLARSPYQNTAALLQDALRALLAETLDAETGGRGAAASGASGTSGAAAASGTGSPANGPETGASGALVLDADAFERVRATSADGLVERLFELAALLVRILDGTRKAEQAIKAASSLHLAAPLADARSQLDALVFPGFVSASGMAALRRYPVYLTGIVHRVERMQENPGRDRVGLTEVETATKRYRDAGGALPASADAAPALHRVRWLLEELRISLFAQQLGTAEPVSLQRITKALVN